MNTKENNKRSQWTRREDELLRREYQELGPTLLMVALPHRSFQSIKCRAKHLGLSNTRKKPRYESGSPETMEEEKELILGEIRFLLTSICGTGTPKLNRALNLLSHAAENSADWFWVRRHKRLGHWCEMFVKDYEFKPSNPERDDFLEGDGVFLDSKGGSDYAFYGRN